MTEEIVPPFSARNQGAQAQIDNDCPKTLRVGLLHLLHKLVEQGYVGGWKDVAVELQRIARIEPDLEDLYAHEYVLVAKTLLLSEILWDKVFDFCERLYGHLAQESWRFNSQLQEREVLASRPQVQEYIASELQRLFLEENLAFEFSDGMARRRGRRHTATQVARAELVLGDPRLPKARSHFNKALRFFRNVSEPDFENVVKEAVCAVEATARALFPSGGVTLGDVVSSITGNGQGQIPAPVAKTFHGLYGFSSGGEGIRHGGTTGGVVTKELAEYALAVSASQIVFLMDLDATLEPDVPF